MQNATCETLLSNWLTNTLMDVDNEIVLLIASSSVFDTNKMIELLQQIERPISCRVEELSNIKNHIDSFEKFSPNIRIGQNVLGQETNPIAKNLVFFVNQYTLTKIQPLIKICRKSNKKIFFIAANTAFNTLNRAPSIGRNSNLNPENLPLYSHCYLDHYDSDPIMLVRDDSLKQDLREIIEYRKRFIEGLFVQKFYYNEQILKTIEQDIELLKTTHLLTSNLAMHLYRLTFFVPEAHATETGRYFHEKLGIKSKTFGSNSKKLKSIGYKPPKSFKAYDLSITMEKQIRLGIASKLIRFIKSNPNQVLSTDDIAKITEISEEEVEEIYESRKRPKK